MVETFSKCSCNIHRLQQGPLAEHIDLLDDRLAARGFSRVDSLDMATPRFVWALHRAQTPWPRHGNESAKFIHQDVCRFWITRIRKLSSPGSRVTLPIMKHNVRRVSLPTTYDPIS